MGFEIHRQLPSGNFKLRSKRNTLDAAREEANRLIGKGNVVKIVHSQIGEITDEHKVFSIALAGDRYGHSHIRTGVGTSAADLASRILHPADAELAYDVTGVTFDDSEKLHPTGDIKREAIIEKGRKA